MTNKRLFLGWFAVVSVDLLVEGTRRKKKEEAGGCKVCHGTPAST